ncbi:polysaccharide biosynthesis tyrosine autokinase (plasmid) [Nostoc sp. UHCC 0302]|uniref:GumC family protein n=1 Tax=Nostoc sp. UHCC 0302 TaxID=3134896 RepID=UPI00311CA64C
MEARESVDVDFNHYLLMLKRRWWLAASIFATTVGLSVFTAMFISPSYEAGGKVLFKVPSFNIVGSSLLPSQSEGGEKRDLRPLVATQNPISTQIEVISSHSLLQQTINKLQLTDEKGEPLEVEALVQNLTLKIIGGTDVLKLTYKSRYPEEAAAVVNTIMKLYLENDILTSREEAKATRQLMERQLPKSKAEVQEAEVAIRRFKQKNNVVNLSEETKSAVAIIANLDSQINNAKAELDQANAQTNELHQKVNINSQQALYTSALSQSPAVQGVLTQLQDIDRQLATERSRFLDNTPIVINLEAKKANLTTLLQKEVAQISGGTTKVRQGLLQIGELKQNLIKDFLQSQVQGLGLAQKLTSLYNSRSAYEQRVKIIPQLEQKQRELERKLEVAQSTYQTLLKKVQELQIAENNNTSNSRIIDQALVPKKPVLREKNIVLFLGVMFGAFLSTTTVLFIERRDRSLKTLQEVREIFKYSLVGTVPLSSKKLFPSGAHVGLRTQEIAVRDLPRSLTSEMYRVMQANLKFLSSDNMLKTIVVTSAVPKEGKSLVSANLAVAIAQLGRQVLLIDADMRVPSQHHLWQLSNTAGLSEVLVGQAKFNNAVCKVMNNLDVLNAGVKPLNPLALLDSKRMVSLIEDCSDKYDFVIIDAPPLLFAADALTLSHMSDGLLLVARPGVIDSSSASLAQEMLERSGQNILGLVVNGISEKNEPSSYFSHAKEYFTAEGLIKEDRADTVRLRPY